MIMLPQASGILSDLAHQEMTIDGGVQAGFSRAQTEYLTTLGCHRDRR